MSGQKTRQKTCTENLALGVLGTRWALGSEQMHGNHGDKQTHNNHGRQYQTKAKEKVK